MKTKGKKKKTPLQRLLKVVRSGAFIGSILLATALWGYASFNQSYTSYIKIPLRLLLPENRAVENPLPSKITIKVNSAGWYLFNLMYINQTTKCVVDLTEKNISGEEYQISRNDLLKSIINMTKAEAVDVIPESLTLKLGKVGIYKVPVVVNYKINPKDGFILVGEPAAEPDSILIAGNERVVRSINNWPTFPVAYSGFNKSFEVTVNLSDSLDNIIKKSDEYVRVFFRVEQAGELTFHDLDIKVKGQAMPSYHLLQPSKISVTIRGGVEQLTKLTREKISAYIDFADIANDSTGVIVPHISIPQGFILQQVYPQYVYHLVRTQTLN